MNSSETHFDVIIIGSGVAGALIADYLCDEKKRNQKGENSRQPRVLMLEAGELGPARADLVSAYIKSPTKSLTTPYANKMVNEHAPSPDQAADYYDQPDPPAKIDSQFVSTYQRRVGGTTWHWLGNCPRLLPNDFKSKTLYGFGEDWPITYDDLEPYYCLAEKEMGVAGDHDDINGLFGAYRSEPFPMHKIWPSYSDQVIARLIEKNKNYGAEFNGEPFELKITPQARNSTPYNGRPVCTGNSSCVPICPVGAKYDATIHVNSALANGAELREKAIVTQILADENGKITGVKYITWGGVEFTVTAEIYVLAANAIESAKLLLMSDIGNSSDMVGRNLMDHPQSEALCVIPEPVYSFRGPPTTSGIDKFRDGNFRSNFAAFRLSMGNDGGGRTLSSQPLIDLQTLPLSGGGYFGEELRKRLEYRAVRQFRISFLAEMKPSLSNRVTPSKTRFTFGVPNPKIDFSLDDYTLDAFDKIGEVLKGMFNIMGGTEQILPDKGKQFLGAGHIMGTLRMGNKPDNSVIDANCRMHDCKNLFVAGSGSFPTGGTANPTLTVAALALRLAEHISKILSTAPVAV